LDAGVCPDPLKGLSAPRPSAVSGEEVRIKKGAEKKEGKRKEEMEGREKERWCTHKSCKKKSALRDKRVFDMQLPRVSADINRFRISRVIVLNRVEERTTCEVYNNTLARPLNTSSFQTMTNTILTSRRF